MFDQTQGRNKPIRSDYIYPHDSAEFETKSRALIRRRLKPLFDTNKTAAAQAKKSIERRTWNGEWVGERLLAGKTAGAIFPASSLSPTRSLLRRLILTDSEERKETARSKSCNVLWSCDSVTLWLCDPVTLWPCDPVTLWPCDSLYVV